MEFSENLIDTFEKINRRLLNFRFCDFKLINISIFLFLFYLRSSGAGAFGRTRSENSALSYRRGFSPSYKNITCVNFHRHFRKLTIQNAILSENFFIFTENSPTGITIVVWKNFVYPKVRGNFINKKIV